MDDLKDVSGRSINFSMALKGDRFPWFFILEQQTHRKPLSLLSFSFGVLGLSSGRWGEVYKVSSLRVQRQCFMELLTNVSPGVRMATCCCRNHHQAWFSQNSLPPLQRPKMNYSVCEENKPRSERNGIIQHEICLGFSLCGENCFLISQTSPLKLLFQNAEGRERALAETVGPGNLTDYVSLKTNQPIQTAASETIEIWTHLLRN